MWLLKKKPVQASHESEVHKTPLSYSSLSAFMDFIVILGIKFHTMKIRTIYK